jgi:beta-lactamase regulating signal transducer with metallopeptidase domain
MNSLHLTGSPEAIVLFKWTGLLALGWLAHGLLRHSHARWRLILWRTLLCCGLMLPVLQFFPVPGIRIPITSDAFFPAEAVATIPPVTTGNAVQTTALTTQSRTTPDVAPSTSILANDRGASVAPRPAPWKIILAAIWALGCGWGAIRLVRLQLQLSRLRKASGQVAPELQRQAAQIQIRLGVRRPVALRISDAVTSPFVCGLRQPMILLPQTLMAQLSPDEVATLLSHEMAHLRRHDLVWCVAWRWMQAICWFHPLVWKIPAAHSLACEQEADRVASGQWEDQKSYAQLLARLALRVLALPPVETQLTVNGSSQIARRLRHLAQKRMADWNWRHSVAGASLVGLLFLLTAGCDFSKSKPGGAAKVEFKVVLVVVQDEAGKPIEGATVLPDGFRVKGIHGADAYGWNNNLFGPPAKATTDHDGKAFVKYPVMGIPAEKEKTGELIFKVSHPEFASLYIQEYSVDSPEQPIHLSRGIHLEVSGYYGSDHQPVTDLIPNLTDGMPLEDWQKKEDGTWQFNKLSSGGHLLQLMGRLPSGEIVYGEAQAFTAQNGKPLTLSVEMKPGVRLEGRIDDNVPRPVKNGRVMIDVRPKEYPVLDVIEDYYAADKKYGGRHFWHSYRPIKEDGTFVFESIPPGEVDIVVLGDGFASKTIGQLKNRVNGALVSGSIMAIPQAFPLVSPVTKIEVTTEPTSTLEFTAKTKSGKPVEGVWGGIYPSAFRMRGIFGWLNNSSEVPFRKIPHLSAPIFSGYTDKTGKLVLNNIPAESDSLGVEHSQFQVPLQDVQGWRDRYVRASFSPGMTNRFDMVMEPKGKSFIGDN